MNKILYASNFPTGNQENLDVPSRNIVKYGDFYKNLNWQEI